MKPSKTFLLIFLVALFGACWLSVHTADKEYTFTSDQAKQWANLPEFQQSQSDRQSQAIQVLTRDVEAAYGTKVAITDKEKIPPNLLGLSYVTVEGLPCIIVAKGTPLRDEVIAHELMHLKRRAAGLPSSFRFTYPERQIDTKAQTLRLAILRHLSDGIEHAAFYPELRRVGFHPDMPDRTLLRQAIERGDLEKVAMSASVAVFYMRCILALNDDSLLKEITQKLTHLGQQVEMQRGRAMAKIVTDLKPTTPEGLISAMVDCANLAFADQAIVGLERLERVKRSSHFQEVHVYLLFEPR